MRTHLRKTGAAAVEMAITMVVLIPLIFLALFLEDFIYYRLNGQEPLVAAAWDHITPDYMTTAPDVGGMNRLKYCDHTAAYDSYDKEFDCQGAGGAEEPTGDEQATGGSGGDLGHHHATGAHQCWLGGGQQLRCSVSRTGEGIVVGAAMRDFHFSPWNKGGTATCSAQLNVFNWIIPKGISEGGGWLWSKKKTTNRTQFGKKGGGSRDGEKSWSNEYALGDAHKDGSSVSASDNQGDGEADMGSWLMSKEQHAVLVDPWALTHLTATKPLTGAPGTNSLTVPGKVVGLDDTFLPGGKKQLLSRTGHYYRKYGDAAISGAMQWNEDMSDYLDESSRTDGKGDNLNSVPVMWTPEKTRRGYKAGYASGYEDSRQGNYSESQFPKAWGPQ